MNFLKKGPEIKLSELKLSKLSNVKVPGFLQDVYYDLKDRHLLPVAAILLVAIFAVPIAISSNSGSGEEADAGGGASASQAEDGATTGALVAKSAPGLRKFERRLSQEQATDPFAIQGGSEGSSGGEAGTIESETGGGESSTSVESSGSSESSEFSFPSPTPESDGGGGSDGGPTETKLTYFSTVIDVRITSGSGEEKKTTVRKNLPELTMLPSRETPAIVFMGATKDSKKAVMTVSSDVQAIFGDAKCVLGSQTCQLLAMEKGLPETFIYGGAAKTYKIEITEIHIVESSKVNKAALGDEGGKGKKKDGDDKSERRQDIAVSDGDQG